MKEGGKEQQIELFHPLGDVIKREEFKHRSHVHELTLSFPYDPYDCWDKRILVKNH